MTPTRSLVPPLCAALLLAAAPLALTPAVAATTQAQLEKNKQLVLDFTEAMAEKNVDKASSYLADGYIQHNPNVPTGKAGFVGFFSRMWGGKQLPASSTPLHPAAKLIAEGDMVMAVFKNDVPDPTAPGQTYQSFSFDAYRIENGKIAEHWDGGTKRAPAPAAEAAPR